jgi:hypothetical protein
MSPYDSMVILLALVPYGEGVRRARGVDFEQRYVSRGVGRSTIRGSPRERADSASSSSATQVTEYSANRLCYVGEIAVGVQ